MNRYLLSRRGSCVPAAIEKLPDLIEGRDFIIEGKVRFTTNRWQEHTWMEIAGEVYDSSLIQFRGFKGYPNVEYSIDNRYGIAEFLAIYHRIMSPGHPSSDFWHRRLRQFGVNTNI